MPIDQNTLQRIFGNDPTLTTLDLRVGQRIFMINRYLTLLQNNKIGDQEALSIANALNTNSSITTLNLYVGQRIFIINRYLTLLQNNNIGENYLSQINTLLEKNKVRIHILPNNENTDEIQKGLHEQRE